jgi:hypothetical protein
VSAEHRELFIYYRVAASNWHDAIDTVRAFQQRLCAQHDGLLARVLRRPDERNGEVTLMETYACVRPGLGVVDESVEARVEAAAQALQPWLLGKRHVERFEALE